MTDWIDEIEARLAPISKLPWQYGGQGWVFASSPTGHPDPSFYDLAASCSNDADAKFIEHAPTDMLRLIGEVRTLRRRLNNEVLISDKLAEFMDEDEKELDALRAKVNRVQALIDTSKAHPELPCPSISRSALQAALEED